MALKTSRYFIICVALFLIFCGVANAYVDTDIRSSEAAVNNITTTPMPETKPNTAAQTPTPPEGGSAGGLGAGGNVSVSGVYLAEVQPYTGRVFRDIDFATNNELLNYVGGNVSDIYIRDGNFSVFKAIWDYIYGANQYDYYGPEMGADGGQFSHYHIIYHGEKVPVHFLYGKDYLNQWPWEAPLP